MNELKNQALIEEKNEWVEELNEYNKEQEISHSLDKKEKISTKKTLTGKYYEQLLHKNPIITLLVIGGILGGVLSVSIISGSWNLWWWIPLSILFIGPLGLVFIALVLPFIPWIIYIILVIIFELFD